MPTDPDPGRMRPDEAGRHARQQAVPGFGPGAQARIAAARVLVVGAGGLAAPLLPYLAGAGVGEIRLVDPDHVETGNLHRQTLFRAADLGLPKVRAAARRLDGLNPACRIEPVEGRADPATIAGLARGMDLVLDCADGFAASYVLSDHCRDAGLPLISAAVTGLSGYCAGLCGGLRSGPEGGAPSLRALFPSLPERAGTCATDGVLGPVVGIVGSLQAQMALEILAGRPETVLGRLVSVDAATWRFGGFRFDGAPEPGAAEVFPFVAPTQIGPEDHVIDLRDPEEAPLATPWARRVHPDAIAAAALPPAGRVVLCCASGQRAWRAAERIAAGAAGREILLAALDTADFRGRTLE